MRAIILAAGEGTRLRPYTLDRPKCLVKLAGRPLLAHQMDVLRRADVYDVTVVTGYRAEQITQVAPSVRHNPDYASTNMVASLMCAADLLDGTDDVLIAYADIVYEARIVETLIKCPGPICTAVDTAWLDLWRIRMDDPLADAETMKLSEDGRILELGRRPRSLADIEGQYMGLTRVRADFAPELVRIHRQLDADRSYDGKNLPNMYMTSFLQYLIDHDQPIRAALVKRGWLEVDSACDLERYNHLESLGRLGDYYQPATVAV